MDIIKFGCQSCRRMLSVRAEFAGKTVRCPACHAKLIIPAVLLCAESPEEKHRPPFNRTASNAAQPWRTRLGLLAGFVAALAGATVIVLVLWPSTPGPNGGPILEDGSGHRPATGLSEPGISERHSERAGEGLALTDGEAKELEDIKRGIQRGQDVTAKSPDGEFRLHRAASLGYQQVALLLLGKGMDINLQDQRGWTPLHHAVSGRQVKLVKLLLERGADPNIGGYQGETPLFAAPGRDNAQNSADIVLLLLGKGAKVNVTSFRKETPLHRACYFGQVDLVRILLDHGADVTAKDLDLSEAIPGGGNTPLHVAVENGHLSVVELLISRGADVNAKREADVTPLHLACDRPAATKALLAAGADIDARDADGATPLHWTANPEVAKILVEAGADVDAIDLEGASTLHKAAQQETTAMLSFLISQGVAVNQKDTKGRTALGWAVARGRTKAVDLLLRNGADINARMDGWTPLCVAARSGNERMVKLLISRKADINATNETGSSALHIAAINGCTKIVELLLATGADIGAKDNHGKTPLSSAAIGGQEEIAGLLVEHGATVAEKDSNGWMPIHWAALNGQAKLIKTLIAKGAGANVRGPNQDMPVHLAAGRGHLEAVRALLDKGALVNTEGLCGTPLHQAASGGFERIVELLVARGADVEARDCCQGTAAHCALLHGQKKVMEHLVKKGVDLRKEMEGRMTALDLLSLRDIHALSKGWIVVIPVKGVIGSDFTVQQAKATLNLGYDLLLDLPNAPIFILDIDTDGGDVSQADEMVSLMVRAKHLRFVAFVRKALSAGVPIALACPEIYVSSDAMIGAAMPYSVDGGLYPKPLDEKFQSVWRAICRKAAQRGGHSPLITDAMIDPGFALTSRKEGNRVVLERDGNGTVLKANGRILVLTASEAVECGLAKSVITTSLDVGQMMKLWSQDEK